MFFEKSTAGVIAQFKTGVIELSCSYWGKVLSVPIQIKYLGPK